MKRGKRSRKSSGLPVSVEGPPENAQCFISNSSLDFAAGEKLQRHGINSIFARVGLDYFAQLGAEGIDFFPDTIEAMARDGKCHNVELAGLGGHGFERFQPEPDELPVMIARDLAAERFAHAEMPV